MNKILNPSIEQLVREIVTVNQAWKEAKSIFEDSSSPIAVSLRNLKTRLQIRLLRQYAPQHIYLIEDKTDESEEPLYGLCLVHPINSCMDAAHLPIRVAQEYLSADEIKNFLKKQ
jgi:hypothetical protein